MSAVTISPIALEQLIYTWAERTIGGTGHGVVLRSSGWPTGDSAGADSTLARLVEYVPQQYLRGISETSVPPSAIEYWSIPGLGNVIAVRRYLGNDSMGRGGRSISHVMLDREFRLTASTALQLAVSSAVVSDWALEAAPVSSATLLEFEPREFVSPCNIEPGLLIRVCAGILLIASGIERVVLTARPEADCSALLQEALRILPHSLTDPLSYSTYQGFPRRSPASLCFVSTSFSEIKPLADPGAVYVQLDSLSDSRTASDPRLSSDLLRVAAAIVELSVGRPALVYPTGVVTPADIDVWLHHRELASRRSTALSLDECLLLARLPATVVWVDRQAVLTRLGAIAGTQLIETTQLDSIRETLSPTEQKFIADAIFRLARAEVRHSPAAAVRAISDARRLGGTLEPFAQAAYDELTDLLRQTPDSSLGDYHDLIAQVALVVGVERQVAWAEFPSLENILLSDWNDLTAKIAQRTWSTDGWAAQHAGAANAVARRHSGRSVDVLEASIRQGKTTIDALEHAIAPRALSSDRSLQQIFLEAVATRRVSRELADDLARRPGADQGMVEAVSLVAVGKPKQSTSGVDVVDLEQRPIGDSSYANEARSPAATALRRFPAQLRLVAERRLPRIPRVVLTLVALAALVLAVVVGYVLSATGGSPALWPAVALVLAIGASSIVLLRR